MSKRASLDDLTLEQRVRLLEFIGAHGIKWKSELNRMWWEGSDANQREGHLLRQIRNTFGPSWLHNLDIGL